MIIFNDMIDNPQNMSKFQYIYEKYKNMMYLVAYNILRNTHDAEDIVEISLIKIIGILSKIKEEDLDKPKCKNLIITITKNSAIDFQRKMINKAEMPYDIIEDYCFDKDVQEIYIDTENYRELISCISELNEHYKEIIRLRVLYDLNSKEIGKLLNISENTVNMRYMRAKAVLLKKIEGLKNE